MYTFEWNGVRVDPKKIFSLHIFPFSNFILQYNIHKLSHFILHPILTIFLGAIVSPTTCDKMILQTQKKSIDSTTRRKPIKTTWEQCWVVTARSIQSLVCMCPPPKKMLYWPSFCIVTYVVDKGHFYLSPQYAQVVFGQGAATFFHFPVSQTNARDIICMCNASNIENVRNFLQAFTKFFYLSLI